MVMKKAMVSELKAHLSAYLERVRKGETVIVCDRTTPIARLSPLDDASDGVRIDEASRSARSLRGLKPIALQRRADVTRMLRESRDQR
jgi:prevent-host-death family protein